MNIAGGLFREDGKMRRCGKDFVTGAGRRPYGRTRAVDQTAAPQFMLS